MSEEQIPPTSEQEDLDEEEERRVRKEQEKLRDQLAQIRNGMLHSPGLALILSDLGKYYILEARADIEGFLTSEDSEERRYALIALAVDFHLPEHVQTARHFLTSDPNDHCRIAATTALGSLMTNTHDRPTLQLLAQVVHNEQEDESIRTGAYRAILSILGASKMEQFLTASLRFHFPQDIKWDMVDEYWEKGEAI
ncbi:MAG: HEAT repeat domain-containing protein [Ktedonobacteraceae bacterium]